LPVDKGNGISNAILGANGLAQRSSTLAQILIRDSRFDRVPQQRRPDSLVTIVSRACLICKSIKRARRHDATLWAVPASMCFFDSEV
jgi:hypothetical protein